MTQTSGRDINSIAKQGIELLTVSFTIRNRQITQYVVKHPLNQICMVRSVGRIQKVAEME